MFLLNGHRVCESTFRAVFRRKFTLSNRLISSTSCKQNAENLDVFADSSSAADRGRVGGASNHIHVVESEHEWNSVLPILNAAVERFPALGFDCEWPPNPMPDWAGANTEEKVIELERDIRKRGRYGRFKVSLIQLATHDGTAVLVRLNRMIGNNDNNNNNIPDSLRKLLSDATCLKVGVEPTIDGRRLTKDYPSSFDLVAGTYDIRYLFQSIKNWEKSEYGVRAKKQPGLLSLNDLCELYLNTKLEKRKRIVCSDWAATVLSPAQVRYAAADAQCAIDVFVGILKSLISYGGNGNKWQWDKIYELCRPHVDDVLRPASARASPTATESPKVADGNSSNIENTIGGKSDYR